MSGTGAKVQMPDGVVYRGWVDEKGDPYGYGTLTFPDGRVSIGSSIANDPGEWDMMATGMCVILSPEKRVERIGLQPMHTRGSLVWESLQDGGFRAGQVDDIGETLHLVSTDLSLNDEGLQIFPDGRVYVGKFGEGRAGQGTHLSSTVRMKFAEHQALHRESSITAFGSPTFDECDGVMLFPDGTVYVGEFTDGAPDGHGAMILPNGFVRFGAYRDGKPVERYERPGGYERRPGEG